MLDQIIELSEERPPAFITVWCLMLWLKLLLELLSQPDTK